MLGYVVLYIIGIFFLFGTGIYTYIKYKKYSGVFFLLSSIFLGLWGLLYILIFGFIDNKDLLLYIFRIMYTLSFISLYSMIFYIYFFGKKINIKIKRNIFFIFFIIALIFIFSPFVVENLKFIEEKGYYFEDYGIGYNLIMFLYILFTPLFLFISYLRIKSLNYINKIRLKIIVLGFSIFMFLSLLFYMFLPYFGIYLFENGIVLFLMPFIYSIIYATNIYNFSDLKFKLGKFIVFSFSLFYSIILVNIFKYYSTQLPESFSNFWGFSKDLGTVDLILVIVVFLISYKFLSKVFLGNPNLVYFEKEVNNFKKYIPYITIVKYLNIFLEKHFLQLFKIKYVNIKIFNKKDNNLELYKYFTKDGSRDLFMNDIVFIEENKYKFNLSKLKKEINSYIYLIFPLFNNKNELIGIFEIGEKPFKEYFSLEEIKVIKDLTGFLVGHLKYIQIYSKINDLNINLDRKVDEKTIEYNQLLNKQTEFISMASHEIKSPIGSCIFQLDYILDEIKDGETSIKSLEKELQILNNTFIKVGDLTNKIFAVQKYDLDKVILYKQDINFSKYINDILFLFGKINNNLKLKININNDIGFVNLDKIQFTQVIDNLLNNALKFSREKNPKINFVLKEIGKKICIEIEDNGKGFENLEYEMIFEKYTSLNTTGVGIGLGLYLCKSIVEMHGGSIKAKNGNKLGGAKFIIVIPKNYT